MLRVLCWNAIYRSSDTIFSFLLFYFIFSSLFSSLLFSFLSSLLFSSLLFYFLFSSIFSSLLFSSIFSSLLFSVPVPQAFVKTWVSLGSMHNGHRWIFFLSAVWSLSVPHPRTFKWRWSSDRLVNYTVSYWRVLRSILSCRVADIFRRFEGSCCFSFTNFLPICR